MFVTVLSWKHPVVRGGVFGALLVGMLSMTAVAQPERGGAIPPEERAKIDTAQAKSVAADLKLEAEATEKLVAAYGAFKKEQAENPPQRPERGDWEAMRKQMDEQQAKLAEQLKTFLDEGQTKLASETLGGFNRGWDRMAQAILGFGLDEAKQAEALGHVLAYVKAGAKARADQAGSTDFEAMRTAMTAAKKSLDDSLAPLLNDAQKAEWAAKTERGPRGDRGEGGERRDRSKEKN